jgi:hypothetical protein
MRDVNHNYCEYFGVNLVVSVMLRSPGLFGLLALIGTLMVAFSVPASAEFFTCSQRPGQLLFSYNGTPDQYIRRQHHYSTPRHYSRTSRYYRAGSSRYRRHATYYGHSRYWNGR